MTAIAIDLAKFCDLSLPGFKEPFVRGGWRYATDCIICVRVPTDEPDTEAADAKVSMRHNEASAAPWHLCDAPCVDPLREVKTTGKCKSCNGRGKLVECGNCRGHGDVTATDDGGYEYDGLECKACYGYGHVAGSCSDETVPCGACHGLGLEFAESLMIEGHPFGQRFLYLMAQLPGVLIGKPANRAKDGKILPFRFDGGGMGLLMERERL